MRPDRLVLVGVFGAPQGVSGEIRVKSFTGDPKAIGAYGPLADARAARVFVFERLRPLKDDMLVVKVKGLEFARGRGGADGGRALRPARPAAAAERGRILLCRPRRPRSGDRDGRNTRPRRDREQLRGGRHSGNCARARRRNAAHAVHQGRRAGHRFRGRAYRHRAARRDCRRARRAIRSLEAAAQPHYGRAR